MSDLIPILGTMIPITALFIPIVAIWTSHQRKLAQMRLDAEMAARGTSSADLVRLREEFHTLRESLTAHAMTLGENVKNLASRLTSVENRVGEIETNRLQTGT